MNEVKSYNEQTFESIKHVNENGVEFWYARELQTALEYSEWRNFEKVINKAKDACVGAGNSLSGCFVDVNKTSAMPNGGVKEILDIKLSEQELSEQEDFERLTEDQKRLAIRGELAEHNKSLAEAAKNAGVTTSQDYAVFQNMGYKGLYGGLGAKQIHERKGLKKSQNILDHMGSTELAANLFRATQTDEKLRRDNIQGKAAANKTHFDVGQKVRKTIEELGGTMPEDLPTPEKSIKQIEKETKRIGK